MARCDECFHYGACLFNSDYVPTPCHKYISTADVAPISDTVNKMRKAIRERCIAGGIYPAFVANVIDEVSKELLEGNLHGVIQ